MKKLFLLLISLMSMATLFAQNGEHPGWLYNTPKAGNNTYYYSVNKGTGTTLENARSNAFAQVIHNAMMRIGVPVSWEEISQNIQNGADWGTISANYNIPINKVCEYTEKLPNGTYIVCLLCQVAKAGNVVPIFDEFSGCYDLKQYSNGGAFIKSVFLPGLGQMGKNHVGSGIFTLLGEAALGGGAYAYYAMAQNQLKIMRNPNTSFSSFSIAKKNYELFQKMNVGLLSAAGALYVWNLYRAFSMKPKYKRVLPQGTDFSFAAIPTEQQLVAGLSLNINF